MSLSMIASEMCSPLTTASKNVDLFRSRLAVTSDLLEVRIVCHPHQFQGAHLIPMPLFLPLALEQ